MALAHEQKRRALPREISEETMRAWLKSGAIVETDCGHENLYFTDQFGHEFFCKCYPNREIRVFP